MTKGYGQISTFLSAPALASQLSRQFVKTGLLRLCGWARVEILYTELDQPPEIAELAAEIKNPPESPGGLLSVCLSMEAKPQTGKPAC